MYDSSNAPSVISTATLLLPASTAACAPWNTPPATVTTGPVAGADLTLTDAPSSDGADIDVVMDSGIRRGSDVVKAVALGAKAVMIGRAYLWGLAANGQAGVENVLDLLRNGIDSALLGLGVASVADLRPEHVLVPDGWARRLGDEAAR